MKLALSDFFSLPKTTRYFFFFSHLDKLFLTIKKLNAHIVFLLSIRLSQNEVFENGLKTMYIFFKVIAFLFSLYDSPGELYRPG